MTEEQVEKQNPYNTAIDTTIDQIKEHGYSTNYFLTESFYDMFFDVTKPFIPEKHGDMYLWHEEMNIEIREQLFNKIDEVPEILKKLMPEDTDDNVQIVYAFDKENLENGYEKEMKRIELE